MRTHRILLPLLLALLALPGCAIRSGTGDGTPPRYRSSDVITPEQVQRVGASTAYDVVQRLRPGWLRARGKVSLRVAEPILVYRDVHREGNVYALRNISRSEVAWMEWVSGPEANQRWGPGHSNGVIVVHTSRGPEVQT